MLAKFCSHCGAPLVVGGRFCSECGTATGIDSPAASVTMIPPVLAGDPVAEAARLIGIGRRNEGTQILERAADQGLAAAAYELGRFYHQDVEDIGLAIRYYRRAVELGDDRALNNLGVILKNRGDIAGARALLERGAALGDPFAMCNLGNLFYQIDDVASARRWWTEAADHGSEDAKRVLGELAADEQAPSGGGTLTIRCPWCGQRRPAFSDACPTCGAVF
ncbi:MAG: hypothetical protein QG597_2868 [Actinomycetota bacterium]|nr:hypothetical protein [Actinomycetota bacterium]